MLRTRAKVNEIIKLEEDKVFIDVSTPKHPNTYTIISIEDIQLFNGEFSWYVSLCGPKLYVRRTGSSQLLHRIITGALQDQLVDHRNRNTLDNTRQNLILTTPRGNALNSKLSKRNTSGFKGVFPCGKKFKAYHAGYHIGVYLTPQLAAQAYDNYVVSKYGEYVSTNKSLGLLE